MGTVGLASASFCQIANARSKARIAGATWPEGLAVTCSFGVAEWHRDEDLHEGIKRADEAMYRAKKGGRDRVEIELDAAESQPA